MQNNEMFCLYYFPEMNTQFCSSKSHNYNLVVRMFFFLFYSLWLLYSIQYFCFAFWWKWIKLKCSEFGTELNAEYWIALSYK